MKILYISGPFNAPADGLDPHHSIECNINTASNYALAAARKGWAPFTPHKNTAGFQHIKDIDNEFWMDVCLAFVQKSYAMLMIPGWKHSPGAVRERDLAINLGIPVYYYTDGIPEVPM